MYEGWIFPVSYCLDRVIFKKKDINDNERELNKGTNNRDSRH